MNDKRSSEVRHAAMACGDDGIWDVALGLILLLFGVVLYLALHSAAAAVVLLVVPGALLAKRRLTMPRLRAYETQSQTDHRSGAAVCILLLVVLVAMSAAGLLLWPVLQPLLWPQSIAQIPSWAGGLLPIVVPVLLALFAVIIMVTVGSMVGAAGRYFLYSAVLAGSFLALLWAATPDWLTLMVPGLLMILVGVGSAARFVLTHPMAPQPRRLRYRQELS